ncbi:hypothetical protein LR48_Vigan11g065900 [Vigna angularis]|uniref:Uncharacterized protein n=1 Tax=Phaseolus angularis TaxID=3914 RepID=A0A0L9VRC5_PHAAN|nr:hypothetical protein LR48_Vigan11g065900 [Vigna angularis]
MSDSHHKRNQAAFTRIGSKLDHIIQKLDDLGGNMEVRPKEECNAVITESLSEKEKDEEKEEEESEIKEIEEESEEKVSLSEKEKDEERKEKEKVEREKKKIQITTSTDGCCHDE